MGSRQVWIFLSPSWPQQCSPLSTVFDLIKVSDEEHQALGGGPIVTVDRYLQNTQRLGRGFILFVF